MSDQLSKVVMRVLQCPRCPTGVETQAVGTVECLRCGAEMEVDSSAKPRIESAAAPVEVSAGGWASEAAEIANLLDDWAGSYRTLDLGEDDARLAADIIRTLARQLAEAKAEIAALSDDVAEYQRNIDAESFALTKAESALAAANAKYAELEAMYVQQGLNIAAATRRVAGVEGLLRRHISADVDSDTTLYAETEAAIDKARATGEGEGNG